MAALDAPAGQGGRPPLARLAGFYLLHFAVVGCFVPFLGPWLASLGHDAVAIGALVAVLAAGRIFAPPLWAWLADARASRLPMVRGCLLAATALFLPVALLPASSLGAGGVWLLGALLLGYGLVASGVLPQFEAMTLNHLAERPERYTVVRLWGSLGFVVAVLLLGVAVDRVGIEVWPLPVLALIAASALLAFTLRERVAAAPVAGDAGLAATLRAAPVWGLLLACLLMQASHGSYYAFFSLHLEAAGYSASGIGLLWALGVVAEVALFASLPWLVRRLPVRALFLACFALAALRWLLVAGAVHSLPAMLLAQILHAASFGLYHGVAIQCVHGHFRGRLQGRGQALYSSVGFGLGGALGSYAAGHAWALLGAEAAWLGSAVLALAGLAVAACSGAGRPR